MLTDFVLAILAVLLAAFLFGLAVGIVVELWLGLKRAASHIGWACAEFMASRHLTD